MNYFDSIWVFAPLLFTVAFLYASVGHGGASGYLALMAIFSFPAADMKSSALILNMLVSLVSFWQYLKGGHFKWSLFLPFIVTSVPAAFLGAFIKPDPLVYERILGVLLIFPILRLFGIFGVETDKIQKVNLPLALVSGAFIGFFSGMIGIGGGILLSPLILLMHWGNMKQTAAVSALFIFVNSVSGFSGLLLSGVSINIEIYTWLLIALAGGFAGAYLARKQFSTKFLRMLLSIVLVIASVKLLTIGR